MFVARDISPSVARSAPGYLLRTTTGSVGRPNFSITLMMKLAASLDSQPAFRLQCGQASMAAWILEVAPRCREYRRRIHSDVQASRGSLQAGCRRRGRPGRADTRSPARLLIIPLMLEPRNLDLDLPDAAPDRRRHGAAVVARQ